MSKIGKPCCHNTCPDLTCYPDGDAPEITTLHTSFGSHSLDIDLVSGSFVDPANWTKISSTVASGHATLPAGDYDVCRHTFQFADPLSEETCQTQEDTIDRSNTCYDGALNCNVYTHWELTIKRKIRTTYSVSVTKLEIWKHIASGRRFVRLDLTHTIALYYGFYYYGTITQTIDCITVDPCVKTISDPYPLNCKVYDPASISTTCSTTYYVEITDCTDLDGLNFTSASTVTGYGVSFNTMSISTTCEFDALYENACGTVWLAPGPKYGFLGVTNTFTGGMTTWSCGASLSA